jgi:hypothetical protein
MIEMRNTNPYVGIVLDFQHCLHRARRPDGIPEKRFVRGQVDLLHHLDIIKQPVSESIEDVAVPCDFEVRRTLSPRSSHRSDAKPRQTLYGAGSAPGNGERLAEDGRLRVQATTNCGA